MTSQRPERSRDHSVTVRAPIQPTVNATHSHTSPAVPPGPTQSTSPASGTNTTAVIADGEPEVAAVAGADQHAVEHEHVARTPAG